MKTFKERVLLAVPVHPCGKNRNNGDNVPAGNYTLKITAENSEVMQKVWITK